jgi:hypothetical protein
MKAAIAGIAIAACSTLSTPHDAAAQDVCPGAWARLLPYAGSYDTDALLGDRDVAAALSSLLGAQRDHLLANLSVRGAADLVSCNLVIEGNADHRGGEENAIVAISLGSGTVAAAMLSDGRVKIYAVGDDYFSVPIPIKDWLAVAAAQFGYRFDPPANVDLVLTKPTAR